MESFISVLTLDTDQSGNASGDCRLLRSPSPQPRTRRPMGTAQIFGRDAPIANDVV
jgi:hypothetical protein